MKEELLKRICDCYHIIDQARLELWSISEEDTIPEDVSEELEDIVYSIEEDIQPLAKYLIK